jgi:hypothetical protein
MFGSGSLRYLSSRAVVPDLKVATRRESSARDRNAHYSKQRAIHGRNDRGRLLAIQLAKSVQTIFDLRRKLRMIHGEDVAKALADFRADGPAIYRAQRDKVRHVGNPGIIASSDQGLRLPFVSASYAGEIVDPPWNKVRRHFRYSRLWLTPAAPTV